MLKGTHIDNHIDQRIQIGNGAAIAHFGILNAERLGLAVDALTRSALRVDRVIEQSIAVERDALDAAQFPVDIFDTAFAFSELFSALSACLFPGDYYTTLGMASSGERSSKAITAICE